jgi:nicotinamidase-related amidase
VAVPASGGGDRPLGSGDLDGNAPDDAAAVLLIIDMINDLEFEGGEALVEPGLAIAREIAALKKEAAGHGIPAVYVNDNYGRWRSDFRALIDHCLEEGVRGGDICRTLQPAERDYFVLKPKHSGFYSTTLDLLLQHLGARTLILTGMAANACVLFTASDAHMREYALAVPGDCVASADAGATRFTLRQVRDVLGAATGPWRDLDLAALARGEAPC